MLPALLKEKMPRFLKERKLLLAILGIGFLVRAWGIWYGLPLFFVGDEHHLPGAALKMAAEKNLIAHYQTLYEPPFLAYLYLVLYVLSFPFLMLWKGLLSISELKGFIILNPTFPWIIARLASACMGAGLVYIAYRIMRDIGEEKSALVAALFMAFDLMTMYLSHFARIWVPGTFLAYLSIVFSLRVLQWGKGRDYLLAGFFAGLSAATTWVTGASILALGAAFFLKKGNDRSWRFFLLAILAYLFIVAGTVAINPYNFFRYVGMHFYRQENYQVISDWGAIRMGEKLNWDKLLFHLKLNISTFVEYNLPVFMASILGVGFFFYRKGKIALVVFIYPLFHFLYFLSTGRFARYNLPVFPAMILAASFGLIAIDEIAGKQVRIWGRYFLPVLALGAVSYSFLLVFLWDYRISFTDTRDQARTWIERNLPDSSRIAMSEDHRVNYFYLQENREAIELVKKIDPTRMGVERSYLLTMDEEEYPRPAYFTIHLNEQGIDANLPDDLVGFFREQKFEYLAVAFWQKEKWRGAKKLQGVPLELLRRFSPGRQVVSDMVDDMRRPLATLWNQKRPGPVVEIYRVNWEEYGKHGKRTS